ncbi:MAG: hypothetical protein R2828_24995 [Saprospiraceae bacterium]
MKNIVLVLLFCCLGLTGVFAQDPLKTPENLSRLASINPSAPGFPTFSNVDRTKGTPYLLDGWQQGQVRFGQNENYSSTVEVAFNMETDQLIVKLTDGEAGLFPLMYLHSLRIFHEGDTLYFEPFNLQEKYGNGPNGYKLYKVLHKGEALLLHYPRKYLRREKYVENLGMVRRPDIYMELNSYWYYDGKQVLEVKKNVKAIQKILPRKAATIKRLVKQENIDLKDNAELGRLFALLEQ